MLHQEGKHTLIKLSQVCWNFFSRKCYQKCHKWFYLPVYLVLSTTEMFWSILTGMTTDYLNSDWLLGDNYPTARLSATLSARALEDCPHIRPRALWQHPSAPSAESLLITTLVNLGLLTTCLHNKCSLHAQTWIASFGITAVLPSIRFSEFSNFPLRQPEMDQY